MKWNDSYAIGLEGIVNYINTLLPVNEHIGEAFRESRPLFPEIAIRELVANALIQHDLRGYSRVGAAENDRDGFLTDGQLSVA